MCRETYQGSLTRFEVFYVTGQVWCKGHCASCLDWVMTRWLIIAVINDLFLKGKQKEEVWCQYQVCLYDCWSIITITSCIWEHSRESKYFGNPLDFSQLDKHERISFMFKMATYSVLLLVTCNWCSIMLWFSTSPVLSIAYLRTFLMTCLLF